MINRLEFNLPKNLQVQAEEPWTSAHPCPRARLEKNCNQTFLATSHPERSQCLFKNG